MKAAEHFQKAEKLCATSSRKRFANWGLAQVEYSPALGKWSTQRSLESKSVDEQT
jgi:hypothetical protein